MASLSAGPSGSSAPPALEPSGSTPKASLFDHLVLVMEQSNAYKRRVNAWCQDHCSRTGTPGEVSDDKPEDPLPVLVDFIDIRPAMALP